jgi:hypothetical protein
MKRVAIICFSNYVSEPRVLRTIEALKDKYTITLYSSDKTINGVNCENIIHLNEDRQEINFYKQFPRLFQRIILLVLKIFKYSFQSDKYYKWQYWSNGRKELFGKINAKGYDLVIGHGICTLPILAKLKTKTIFNAHEYYLKEFEENLNWKKYTQPYYKYLLDNYLPRVDMMFCVSKLIQDEYKKHHTIKSIEVTNATAFCDLKPNQLGPKIKIIHHGGAIRARQLELMGQMMDGLDDNYTLTFMLTPTDLEYLNDLKNEFKNKTNVFFIEPVTVNEIAKICNNYDIGLFILPPVNFNWYYALPNKLFEFIQGRLCLAVSPNPDMKRVVEQFHLGVVSTDYTSESMAQEIKKLTSAARRNFQR